MYAHGCAGAWGYAYFPRARVLFITLIVYHVTKPGGTGFWVNQKTVIISGILTSPLLLRKEAAYWQYMTELGHVRTCLDLMCVCIYTTVTHISERLGTGERFKPGEAAEATEAATLG
jgi:hypothetical protein